MKLCTAAAHLLLPVLNQLGQAERCGHARTADHHHPLQRLPERHHQLWAAEEQRGAERPVRHEGLGRGSRCGTKTWDDLMDYLNGKYLFLSENSDI